MLAQPRGAAVGRRASVHRQRTSPDGPPLPAIDLDRMCLGRPSRRQPRPCVVGRESAFAPSLADEGESLPRPRRVPSQSCKSELALELRGRRWRIADDADLRDSCQLRGLERAGRRLTHRCHGARSARRCCRRDRGSRPAARPSSWKSNTTRLAPGSVEELDALSGRREGGVKAVAGNEEPRSGSRPRRRRGVELERRLPHLHDEAARFRGGRRKARGGRRRTWRAPGRVSWAPPGRRGRPRGHHGTSESGMASLRRMRQ